MKRYHILIVEPSLIVKQGLMSILEASQFNFTYDFDTWDNSLIHALKRNMDIIIINPLVIEKKEIAVIQEFMNTHPNIFFIALVYTYISSDILQLFHCIINIEDDSAVIVSKLHTIIDNYYSNSSDSELTVREKEVLIMLAKGIPNKIIADRLNISLHTVATHRKHLLKKTNMKSIGALTAYAILNNLIDENDLLSNIQQKKI